MSPDNTRDGRRLDAGQSERSVRTQIRQSAATGELDESLIELLTWILETDTHARIYLYLRQQPGATSEEIATGTGLYPSTVRETLSVLREEEIVRRNTRELSDDNNPSVYVSIPPNELVLNMIEQIQDTLNTVFVLDELLGVEGDHSQQPPTPISVTVREAARSSDEQ